MYTIVLFAVSVSNYIVTCTTSCQSGGICTAPNTYTYDVGQTGMQCETGAYRGSCRHMKCGTMPSLIPVQFAVVAPSHQL